MGVVFASLLVLAGCWTDPGTQATVEFWGMGREGQVVEELIPEFERRNPGVRVHVQQIPWSAAHEKLLTAYVGGVMPDLFQLGNTWLPELVAVGALEPLDAWIAASSAVTLDDYFAGIVDTNTIGQVLYGVPWYVDTRLLFYRRDILAVAGYPEPPRSWESWLQAMQRIKEHDPRNYAILLPVREWQPLIILALQRGAELLRDDQQFGSFRSPPFRVAFDFYLDVFRRQLTPHAAEAQVANLYRDFAEGYFAMYVTGPWNIGEFSRRLPSQPEDSWSTAPMPAADENYPGVSVAGGASLVLSRASGRKAAAWRLVEYLSEPRQQIEFHRLTGDLPARKSAWIEGDLVHHRHASAFWEQLQATRSTPKIPEWERIASKITHYTEAAVRGDLSPEQALAALDRDVDVILEKRRWLLRRMRPAASR
jgi:multiple sugar transport system substrate-binding protein